MRKIYVGLLFVLVSISFNSQTLKPVERKVGKLTISVDPRMELLSTVQVLSGYPVIDRTSAYSKEVQEYFRSFSSQPAVAFTDTLYKLGFSYDAAPAFMLQLSEVPELRIDRSNAEFEYVSRRAKGSENLNTYRDALAKFAKDSDFGKFWETKTDFFRQIIDTTIANMQRHDLVECMEKYYNESQHSYNIILSPLFGQNNYGPSISRPDGKSDIYSCNGLITAKDEIPYLTSSQISSLVWHEFGHSFVNDNSDKNITKVLSYEYLFEPIRDVMKKMAYGNWKTCVNEHIVRAVVIRLMEINMNKSTADRRLQRELNDKFIYIQPIIEKLKEFEARRDKEGITFSEYYPELLNAFEGAKPAELSFAGPINNVMLTSSKMVIIYPTAIADSAKQKKVKDYVEGIFKIMQSKMKQIEIKLMADTEALSAPLTDYAIVAYGTLESNLFLSRYKDLYPFSAISGKLIADKEYSDTGIKMVSCLPHPQNPQLGMTIYTALSDKDIININNVFHGPEDYVIFTDRNTILKKGNYTKNGKWKF